MKKFNLAKILSLVFVCVMLVGALALTSFASEDENVDIVAANLYYGDVYQIMFAVDAPDGVTVSAVDSKGNAIGIVPFAEAPVQNVNGVDCKIYILEEGVAAQALNEVITVTAQYGDKKATKNCSVLQYLFTRMESAEGAELEMLQAFLAYAAKADVFFNGTSAEATFDKYQKVTVSGLTVNGVNPTGVYAPGATPFANIDEIVFDASKEVLTIVVGDNEVTVDELKALVVGSESIYVDVMLTAIPGTTQDNPIYIFDQETVVTVPANSTYYFATYNNGAELYINGELQGIVTAFGRMPYVFAISNETDVAAEYEIKFVIPKGTMDNPAELVIGANEVSISAGSQGYFFTWIATGTGKLTLTIATDAGWVYSVNNLTTYVYGDTQWSDSDPVVNPAVIDVNAGDEIQIMVNTYDPADPWAAPAGILTVTAEFAVPHTHNYTSEVTDPTCTADGYTTFTCEECGDSYTEAGETATGHKDENGDYKCDVCSTIELPAADSTLTIEQALKLGALYAHNTYTEGKYYVTGNIKSVYNTTYGNMYIVDENGNELCIYGTYSADGSTRYDKLESKPVVSDTVTIYGIIGTYNDTIQIKNGWIDAHTAHQCVAKSEATCTSAAICSICDKVMKEATGHNYVDGVCDACGAEEPTSGETVLPENLSFSGIANKASADSYMQANFPEWTITGKLGNGYAGYLGFGRSGDGTSSIKSSAISTSTAFTIKTVLKGNGSSGVVTSTLTFTLVDADGNIVATGYADGSTTAAIAPADAKDTTYNISFTFVEGKTWSDVSNLVVSFAKATGNIGLKSLDFIQ